MIIPWVIGPERAAGHFLVLRSAGRGGVKIKAAVLNRMGVQSPYALSKPLSIDEVELDPPGRGEVLVKIAAAGLCHSDLSVINGDRPRPTPMVLGHEAAGVVEEPGPGVDDLEKGDHVIMGFVPSCGDCPPCAEGRPALCEPSGRQHRRHAALRCPAAASRRQRRPPPSGCLGVRRIRHRIAPLAGEDRPRAAAR
jgi:Zn-dependent alcohol dehydrogenase